jgi:DNA polymerase I-like protein with 3'-5' exonuclease and polymerase domains
MLHTVHTVEELRNLVEVVTKAGEFAFDVESRGVLERHDDLHKLFLKECKEHIATLKNPGESIVASSTETIRSRYMKQLALDPLRNEVFWISIATLGHSWAIPMGHKLGEVIVPEERGDGTTIPPPGFRKFLANGGESMAKAKYVIPGEYSAPPEQLSRSVVFEELRPLFFSDFVKVGHNVKFDARSIQKYYGELPPGPYMDTMILQHLEDENSLSFSLTNLVAQNFGGHDAYSKEGKLGAVIDTVPFSTAARYVHLDARWTWLLYSKLMAKLRLTESLAPAIKQDMEVLRVIMTMEDEGITVKTSALKDLRKELEIKQRDCLLEIVDMSYAGFNPDSNKDKQNYLFTKKREGGLGLKPYKTTPKGAPSVDMEALEKLRDAHPLIPLLISYSELQKLKSTYVDGLIPKLNNGKLHPSYNLHRTATGRLSSNDPNLQNIPRDSSIRSLFVPPPGYTMLVADYDQIELRVMAMFSQDPQLLRIFRNNEDIHAATAAAVFKKDLLEVTSEERQIGKGVNFLTAYGGGSGKLARTTGIADEHAEEILNSYYKSFSGLTKWKQVAIARATKSGYVSTLSGRRRRLPGLTLSRQFEVSRAQRQAINAIIQGSAADICKQAMIDVDTTFSGTDTKMLVQVHDELIVITPKDQEEVAMNALITAMGHDRSIMGVTLKVSCHAATSWSEAKGK